MTPTEALIASIYADDALATAEDFERDLVRARENIPDDFSVEELAALNMLMDAAVRRVEVAKIRAGLEIKA